MYWPWTENTGLIQGLHPANKRRRYKVRALSVKHHVPYKTHNVECYKESLWTNSLCPTLLRPPMSNPLTQRRQWPPVNIVILWIYISASTKPYFLKWQKLFQQLNQDSLCYHVTEVLAYCLGIHRWRHLEYQLRAMFITCRLGIHDDVIKWKHFPRNWPFVRSRWIPHTKASDAELWCFLWSASE